MINLKGFKPLKFKLRKCRVCGCSWFNACPGSCWWVEKDLCSHCQTLDHQSNKTDKDYYFETLKLNKLENYRGRVFSIYDENILITQEELGRELLKMLTETNGAPTVVWSESGERLNMMALYMECVVQSVVAEAQNN